MENIGTKYELRKELISLQNTTLQVYVSINGYTD